MKYSNQDELWLHHKTLKSPCHDLMPCRSAADCMGCQKTQRLSLINVYQHTTCNGLGSYQMGLCAKGQNRIGGPISYPRDPTGQECEDIVLTLCIMMPNAGWWCTTRVDGA